MKFNKDDAPEGYVAVAHKGCAGCAFHDDESERIWDNCSKDDEGIDCECGGFSRDDHTSVIFVKKSEEDVMEFDKSKVYTVLNKDKLKVGSSVYLADNLGNLQSKVEDCDESPVILGSIGDEYDQYIFAADGEADEYALAYLVSELNKANMYTSFNADELSIGDKVVVGDTLEEINKGLAAKNYSTVVRIHDSSCGYRIKTDDGDYALAYKIKD